KEFDEADYGFGKPLFLATSWDLDVVRKHNGLFVPVGTPNNFEVVLNRTYYGYRGALTLLEKIYSEVVRG
ncbi:MAG: hydrogenase, partial [Oscillospiraceae bacterium]|nr:hydrogenase [Oscillospiraceae bacterium]